jgi:drug/metabolite transporter (DMT)-like permease
MLGQAPSRRAVLSALLAVQVLFGINYVVSKIVVGHFPPLVWASLRITISAAAMLLAALLSRRPHPPFRREYFVPMIGYALLGTVINQASFLVGLSHTTSTNSSILNTLIPVFTLLVVTVRGQEPLTGRRIAGFVLAFGGVLVLRRVEELSLSDRTLIGDLLTMLNCFSYALFLSFSKKFLERYDPIWTTTWLFIYGSVGITLLALPDYARFTPPAMTTELWLVSAYAIFGATLAPYFLNFWALGHARSSQVALFIYLQPVVTSAINYFWFGEVLTARMALASGFIFAGLLLGLSAQGAAAPAARREGG